MGTTIKTLEGCRAAYPGKAVDEEALRDACINNVSSGRGHFAGHITGMPDWLDSLMQVFGGSPLFALAAAVCVVVWLVLMVKVIGAPNLRAGQKVGWVAGLTFLFPVFSVLYLALAPVAEVQAEKKRAA